MQKLNSKLLQKVSTKEKKYKRKYFFYYLIICDYVRLIICTYV